MTAAWRPSGRCAARPHSIRRMIGGRTGVTGIGAAGVTRRRFQDLVRKDLQQGVVRAIAELGPALGHPAQRGHRSVQRSADDRLSRVVSAVRGGARTRAASASGLRPGVRDRIALSRRRGHGTAAGLWEGLAAVTRLSRTGCESGDLIVRPFNGRLFARGAAPSLECDQAGVATRRSRPPRCAPGVARRARHAPGPGGREEISYSDLGVEQLGAVYERVLDLDPDDRGGRRGRTHATAGAARKPGRSTRRSRSRSSSSAERWRRWCAARRATTSSRFAWSIRPWAAARFWSPRAAISRPRTNARWSPKGDARKRTWIADERAEIRRTVAVHCLSGVDANPTAVQLARLSLWLTTLARDKPLSFLDDRLRVGNSLDRHVAGRPLARGASARADHDARIAPLFDAAGLEGAIRTIAKPLRQLRRRSRRHGRRCAREGANLVGHRRRPVANRTVAAGVSLVVRAMVLAARTASDRRHPPELSA